MLISLIIILTVLSLHGYVILSTWKPSLYEKLNIWRDTPNEEIRKKKREALIKYHPDKLKGEEKELYGDMFINLNNYFDTITSGREQYDLYNEEKKVEEGPKYDSTDPNSIMSYRLSKVLVSAPFFILWAFVTPSYLHKEKWNAKIACLCIVGLFGLAEFMIIGQYWEVKWIDNVVPTWMTYWEFFYHL